MNRQFISKFLQLGGIPVIGACVLAFACVGWGFAGVAGATTLTALTISGTAQEGKTLTANPGTPGPATDTFDPPTYQWLLCPPAASCANGPTGATLALTSAEVGDTIEVTETVNDNAAGATPPNPAVSTSTPTSVVLPPAPTPLRGSHRCSDRRCKAGR